jgi:asparagine synthase (glutamine-hydrolysing)
MAERLEMAHALEVRLPYLDHEVFEIARAIPVELLIRGQQEKYALRQAVRPYVADRIYRRRKHSFTAPPATSQRDGALFALLQDTLRSPRFNDQPFFDARVVKEFLDEFEQVPDRLKVAVDSVLTIVMSIALLRDIYSVN